MGTKHAKVNTKPKLRFGVMYFRQFGKMDFANPDTWGSTSSLVNAYGKAAQHVARSDVPKSLPNGQDEYRLAVVYDRHRGAIVRSYKRTGEGITIKDY